MLWYYTLYILQTSLIRIIDLDLAPMTFA